MKIVNIIKDSFQEFSGEHSLVLFSYNCNLKCSFCYNYDYTTDKDNIVDNAIQIMKDVTNPLHTAVVFLGGEPTIWGDDLIKAVEYAKSKKLKVKVYTNGYNYNVIPELCNYVDSFSVDFKCVNDCKKVTGVENYLRTVTKTINKIISEGIDVELRTTIFDGLDVDSVKRYVSCNFPTVRHILTGDFRKKMTEMT
jgi:pyruvate formate lyase activating enzyme